MRLAHFLRRSARLGADRVAVIDGDARFTWADFEERVARLAAVLARHAAPGARVATLLHTSHRCVETYFAPLWCGMTMVPLNHRWTLEECADAMALVTPSILIVDRHTASMAQALMERTPSVAVTIHAGAGAPAPLTLDYETALAAHAPMEDVGLGGDAAAALFFTSGTSGRPKAATLTHANLAINAMSAMVAFRLSESSVQLHAQPLFHLAGGARVYNITLAGGVHICAPRFDAGEVLAAIEKHGVTHLGVVPTMLAMLLDHPQADRRDLSSLQVIGYGAAPMPLALMERAMARLPCVGFVQSYGMTELSPVASSLGIEDHAAAGRGFKADRLRSVGRAVFHVDVSIRRPDGSEAGIDEVGEVCVRGPTVMAGYWNDPQATQDAVRNGWMHTGDAGAIDADGYLYLVDRIKDIIITGGENVASTEVENALYRHPSVAECAVVAAPHAHWGEVVHAVVVPKEPVTQAELEAHCRTLLAGFKRPRSWDIRTEPLPRNPTGKVLKHVLRASAAASGKGGA